MDPVEGPSSSRQITAACTPDRERSWPIVAAAGDGFALLECVPPPGRPEGPYRTFYVVDLATGELTWPPVPDALRAEDNFRIHGVQASGICYSWWQYKGPFGSGVFDWRTGRIEDRAPCTSVLRSTSAGLVDAALKVRAPDGRTLVLSPAETVDREVEFADPGGPLATWGARPVGAASMRAYAYVKRCGVRFEWRTSATTQAVPIGESLVVSESIAEGGPYTLRRVDFAGACSRAARAWKLSLTVGGRRVGVAPRTASTRDQATGTTMRQLTAPPRVARLAIRGSSSATVRLGAPATSVRWRTGASEWRAARGGERTWTLETRRPLKSSAKLQLRVHFAAGRAEYAVRLG